MEYLGEFLSTTNSISDDQDKITKYFYYRPDRYDDPSADLENIFSLRALSGFPQIGDKLSENNNYELTNIDINKRIDDTQTGVKKVSYVVTCTYGSSAKLLAVENKKRERKDNVQVDKHGELVTVNTKPWDLKQSWSRQPISVEVPFLKAYDRLHPTSGAYIDVVNKAGKRLLASTTRYRFEYTIKLNCLTKDTTLDFKKSYVNSTNWTPKAEGIGEFPAGTVLIQPPTYELKYFQEHGKTSISDTESYYSYTIKLIFDEKGWYKNLLNIGTFAKFSANTAAEQIYSYRTISGAVPGPLNFTNLAGVLEAAGGGRALSGIAYEKVTESMPLTLSGYLDTDAINDPVNHPYKSLSFQEYEFRDFHEFTEITYEL